MAKRLNIRPDTIILLEKNTGKTFSDINCSNAPLGQSPKAIETKVKINKRDLMKFIKGIIKRIIKKREKQSYRLRENICK